MYTFFVFRASRGLFVPLFSANGGGAPAFESVRGRRDAMLSHNARCHTDTIKNVLGDILRGRWKNDVDRGLDRGVWGVALGKHV